MEKRERKPTVESVRQGGYGRHPEIIIYDLWR